MSVFYTLIFIYNFFIFEEIFTAAESTILAAGLTIIYAIIFNILINEKRNRINSKTN